VNYNQGGRVNYNRLNLASGNHPSGDWGVDVDMYFAADVQAHAGFLPFRDGVFDLVYLGHFL
jgi:hypothetical protein